MRKVVDGDTVVLESGEKVRLIGINAPELHDEDGREEPLARQARSALRELVGKRPVQLIDGAESSDKHGRRLAYLQTVAGIDAQEELLRQGFAAAVVFPPNMRNRVRYRQAEGEARAARRGIWNQAYFRPLEVDKLNTKRRGFLFLQGEVERITSSRKYVTLWMSRTFALLIDKQEWRNYWSGRPSQFLQRRVVARGWLFAVEDGRRMRIRHPDMLAVDGEL